MNWLGSSLTDLDNLTDTDELAPGISGNPEARLERFWEVLNARHKK